MSRVALIGENSIEYVKFLIQIWNEGDCAVLLDWRIPMYTLCEMMKESNVTKCYIEKEQFDKISLEIEVDIEFVIYEKENNSARLLTDEVYDSFNASYSREEAVILYSSGTTGRAKGVILSHYAINVNADSVIDYMMLGKNDCMYISKVFSHSSTLVGELLVSLKTRTSLVVAPTIVPPRFVLKNINKFGVSIICLNPTLLYSFINEYKSNRYQLLSLKKIFVSGSILNETMYRLAHECLKNINVYNVYGLSEAGPRVAAQRESCCKENSVGKPIKGVEIAIVDGHGNIVEQGKRGIIHVKTKSCFEGYVIGKKKYGSLYKDWLNTGDEGYIDVHGELHIVGRIDDLIIINAYKIYPYDIEKLAFRCSEISECKALYDERIGFTFVYTTKYLTNIDAKLAKIFKDKLAYYEIPSKIIPLEYMPKTPNGKVDISTLKELLISKGG